MLNGIAPVILFVFRKNLAGVLGTTVSAIPVEGQEPEQFPLPIIPLYLDEGLTGIVITSESKSLDVDTTVETTSASSGAKIYQKGISNSIKVELTARSNSIGVTLFAAMADLIFARVTSKEYSVTYLHGAITVFEGLLHSFSIEQNAETDLYKITFELQKPGGGKVTTTQVPNTPGLSLKK